MKESLRAENCITEKTILVKVTAHENLLLVENVGKGLFLFACILNQKWFELWHNSISSYCNRASRDYTFTNNIAVDVRGVLIYCTAKCIDILLDAMLCKLLNE